MTKPNDGGPAFPRPANPPYNSSANGMSLRDWFAGQVLAGLLACPHGADSFDGLAMISYAYADAMLKARGQDG